MENEEDKNTQKELKIIVVGNSGTGKTSFVNKWIKGTFSDFYKATIVSEFSNKIYEYKEDYYRIQLWDLAGQDKNTCITKIFSKGSDGVIVLCDITNEESLKETLKWKDSVDESTRFKDDGYLPAVLVQNKIDLVDEDKLKNDEEIKKFTEENKFDAFFRTSAKMGIGIDECMDYLISNIIERAEKCAQKGSNPFEKDRKSMVLEHKKLTEESPVNNNGCC